MEPFNRIELQGMCSRMYSPIGFAGQPVGYKFHIKVDSGYADEESRQHYFIPCQVMLLPGTPTADFTYFGGRQVHLIGRLTICSAGALVEVTEIEYVEED